MDRAGCQQRAHSLFANKVTWENNTGKEKKKVGVGEIKLRRGEIGVTVQWYTKCADQDEPDLNVKYKITDLPPCVQSATSLVSAKFNMTQMKGKRAATAYTRRQGVGETTPFVRYGGFKATEYRKSHADVMKEKQRETWELDLATYNSGINAVDWFVSR